MFQTSQVEHSYAAICAAAYEYVDTVGAEPDVENLLVVSNELGFSGQGWYVPDRTGGIDARGDDETGGQSVPIQRGQRGGVFGRFGVGKKRQRCQLLDRCVSNVRRPRD